MKRRRHRDRVDGVNARLAGGISAADVAHVLEVIENPGAFLSEAERTRYEECQQSIVDARRSAIAHEGRIVVG